LRNLKGYIKKHSNANVPIKYIQISIATLTILSMEKKANKKEKKETKVSYSKRPEKISFEEWQIALRRQFALEQKFKVKNTGAHLVYSDFDVSNSQGRKTYKVAIRGNNIGFNFCSCPDFKVNNLGTCKHIEYVLNQLRSKRINARLLQTDYERPYSSVTLKFGAQRKIVLRIGTVNKSAISKLANNFFDNNFALKEEAIEKFDSFLEKVRKLDPQFRCYSEALDFIISARERKKRIDIIEKNLAKEIIALS